MTRRERLLGDLNILCNEEYDRGWNVARAIYHTSEKELGERERKGYKLGHDLGYTDGFDTGHTKGLWAGQCVTKDLTGQLARALEGNSQAYQRGRKIGYDDGHKDGYYKARTTIKTQIEQMLLDEIA